MTRNDGYHGAMPARNGGIDFRFYTSTDAAFMDVIAGNLDLLDECRPRSTRCTPAPTASAPTRCQAPKPKG